jgi:hypothetical protein
MKDVFTPPGGGPMQAFRLALVAPALGLGNFLFDTAVELPCEEFLAIARGGRIL